MNERFITEVVKTENLTLSQLIWRRLRRQPLGYIERVFQFNRGIARDAPFLAIGTVVNLPIEDIDNEAVASTAIRLWD